jgi:hypothetical protein
VAPGAVVERLDVLEDLGGELAAGRQQRRCTSSVLSVAKKLSATALASVVNCAGSVG